MSERLSTGAPKSGVIVLGNDRVLDFLTALFKSLRRYNADLPAYLIPYDARMEKTRVLMERYQVSLFSPPDLERWNRLPSNLFGKTQSIDPMFRKLACFSGPLETFLYLDADIVILSDLTAVFQTFEKSGADFLSFDHDITNVYTDLANEKLRSIAEKSKGFNAGAFLSRRDALGSAQIEEAVLLAAEMRQFFKVDWDQSFLNLLVDTSGIRHASLRELDDGYASKQWADIRPVREFGDAWRLMKRNHPDFNLKLPWIHWAGHQSDAILPNLSVYYRFRLLDSSIVERWLFICRHIWSATLNSSLLWARGKIRRILNLIRLRNKR